MDILHRYTGAVLYSSATAQTIAEAVVEAVRNGANLVRANLYRANLEGANLEGANLECAKTSEATKIDRIAITLVGSRHVVTAYSGRVRIGCQERSYANWLEVYKRVGKMEGYTAEQIEEYGGLILRAQAMFAASAKAEEELA